MKQPKEWISADEWDIRIMETGANSNSEPPRDLGVVEGYPLDPPDDAKGWKLVSWSLHAPGHYVCVWAKPKKRKVARAAKKPPETAAPPKTPSKRGRKPKEEPKSDTKQPELPNTGTSTAAE